MRTIVPNDQRLNKFECFRQRIQPTKRNLEIREKAVEKQKKKKNAKIGIRVFFQRNM